jgi:hypothetical protein
MSNVVILKTSDLDWSSYTKSYSEPLFGIIVVAIDESNVRFTQPQHNRGFAHGPKREFLESL